MEKNTMRRRQVLQYSSAGLALATSAKVRADGLVPVTQDTNQSNETITNEVDVLVVGGGTAGTIAAIQAARAGARDDLAEYAFGGGCGRGITAILSGHRGIA